MNRRILIVDETRRAARVLRGSNAARWDLRVVGTGEEALELCRTEGPFAVVLVDDATADSDGVELLRETGEGWPDTSRILLTADGDLDRAVEALQHGRIFRLLKKPLDGAKLIEAVEEGIERFAGLEAERLLTEQLLFSRESLLSLTEVLDRRLTEEIGNQENVRRLSARLSASNSLQEVAATAAAAISVALEGRGTRVNLISPDCVEAGSWVAGRDPDASTFVQPVRTPDGDIGSVAVELADLSGEGLTPRDRRVLSSLVSSIALAAHSRIRQRERDQAQEATVFALARLAEERDDEVGRHLQRVSEYSRLIALGLREDGAHVEDLSDEFIDRLSLSAPLHDIGKVGIPDAILLKPGKLDRREWEIMKQHTVIGAETMRSILECSASRPEYLRMGLEIAWCHHERWNGSGYPRGLAGEEIPLSARIVALADVYDALTTRRPYKGPWSHGEALALVEEERGRHFDPRVADAFLSRAHKADEIRIRLADVPG